MCCFKTRSQEELEQLEKILKENLDLFPSSNFRDNIEFKQKDSELWVIRTDKTFNKETETTKLFENEFLFGVWMNFIINKLRTRRYVKDFSEFQGNKIEKLKSFKTVIKDMKFEQLKKKLPELEGIFESLLNDVTFQNYGYHLKTFTKQEENFLERLADEIVKKAEAIKIRVLDDVRFGIKMRGIDTFNSIFEPLKKQMINEIKSTDNLWQWFYTNTVSDLFPIYLYQVPNGDEFYLDFVSFSSEEFAKEVKESQGWKEDIIRRLKAILSTEFMEHLDAVSSKSISFRTKDFFDWREEKLKYQDLSKKLPELEGIFENKEETKDYILEITVNYRTTKDRSASEH